MPLPDESGGSHKAVRVRVVVSGRVQGVFFRATTRDRAASLGLTGWVRNRRDGRVEAVFEGPIEKVSRMVAWCRRGPASARVDGAEVSWEEPTGEFSRFNVTF
jgi:acylphosphatase